MQAEVLATLVRRRTGIHRAWEVLLRTERASSPMANPDTLVFLMDWTLDGIFAALAGPEPEASPAVRPEPCECACGLHPMLAYFASMRQVLAEALVLAQASLPEATPRQREADLMHLKWVVDAAVHREIAAFCSLCQRRHSVAPVGAGYAAGEL